MFKIISPFETPPQEFWPCTRLLVGSLGAVRFASSFHCSRARLYTVRECFVYAMVIFCTHKQTPPEPVKFILFAPHQTNTHTHQQQAIGLDLTLVNVPRRPGQCASERERVCRDFDARSTWITTRCLMVRTFSVNQEGVQRRFMGVDGLCWNQKWPGFGKGATA